MFKLLSDPNLAFTYGNYLLGAGIFMTVATTLWTTILIAYRIYSVSKENIRNQGKRRFHNVLEIILQSSIVYSVRPWWHMRYH